jgi:hypothetical protein
MQAAHACDCEVNFFATIFSRTLARDLARREKDGRPKGARENA